MAEDWREDHNYHRPTLNARDDRPARFARRRRANRDSLATGPQPPCTPPPRDGDIRFTLRTTINPHRQVDIYTRFGHHHSQLRMC
jgi:hypothetical protein